MIRFFCLAGLALLPPAFAAPDIEMAERHRARPLRSKTSSTLGWADSRSEPQPPPGAVQVQGTDMDWCRASIHGQWAAGSVREGVCVFPFLKSVHQAKDFQTLVSINGSARLVTTYWDKFVNVPHEGVTTGQMVLALDLYSDPHNVKVGFVSNRQAYVTDGETVSNPVNLTILVEDEPVEYELINIVLSDKGARREFSNQTLGEFLMENPSSEDKYIEIEEDFILETEQYWGSTKGTITGTKFSTPEKSNMKWVTYNADIETHKQKVGYQLPAGTAVRGRLVANMSRSEAQYSASLTAIYSDGFQMTRPITSLHSPLSTLMASR